ncbi:hypothetical protein AVEN_250659-1 [Araneus ventricosus]|uniref:DUF4817 domain-containing protein n=1 Tax=Araneus ventricosus TaxID=182803 RepID=A0A4Y2QIP7_ARAVE|nr:hypothetical protein AVEN_250659-1 [Araneus ventricosus]
MWTPQEKAQCVARFIETKSDSSATELSDTVWIPTNYSGFVYVIYGNRLHSLQTGGGLPICFRRQLGQVTAGVCKEFEKIRPELRPESWKCHDQHYTKFHIRCIQGAAASGTKA